MNDTAQSDANHARPNDVNELVALVLERIESEGEAVVERLCSEYPEHAEALKRRLSNLRRLGLLDAESVAPRAEIPERLGGFRLKRLLGGGGMGVVYLAEQEGLGREVALKLIRPEHLYFPGARARFTREVETIARLQHPAIVPIYTVGEENGVPYFTMQRVHGCTLHEALEALSSRARESLTGADLYRAIVERTTTGDGAPPPDVGAAPGYVFLGTYEEAVLHLLRQVADALEHAHRRDVTHRDVKPSNVMVTPEGRAMLLDFGLAVGSGNDRFTRSGLHLGSVPYMSPEQACGDLARVTARSDVYSLGVTLYEMLTLELPFQGGSTEETLSRIFEGRPEPPRRRNPAITWEAETVCLTAMENEAARRYASAADFMRDVENVLEHRPIEARRAGPLRRLDRWVRRRPAEATAAALAVLLVIGAPTALYLNERANLGRIQEQRERAERNFRKAREAVDALQREVADVDLRFVPQMEPVRRRLLERAAAFYDEFLQERADDDAIRREQARSWSSVGEVRRLLGALDAAGQAFDRAITTLEDLRVADPANPDVLRDLARALRLKSLIPRASGRIDESMALTGRAIELHRELERIGATTRADRRDHSEALYAQATLLLGTDPVECERRVRAALVPLEAGGVFGAGAALQPVAEEFTQRATILNVLASSLWDQGRMAECVATYREASTLLDAALREQPGRPDVRFEMGGLFMNLGIALQDDHPDESEAEYRRSLEIIRGLVRDFPAIPDYRLDLGSVLLNLELLMEGSGRQEDALGFSDEALRVLDDLVASNPGNDAYANALSRLCGNRANLLRVLGRTDEALALGARAVELRREIFGRHAESPDQRSSLAAALHNYASVVRRHDDPRRAEELLREAVSLQESARAAMPGNPTFLRFLRNHHWSLAEILQDRDDWTGAEVEVDAIVAVAPEDPESWRVAATVSARGMLVLRDRAGLGDAERTERIDAQAQRAIRRLEGAIERGFRDASRLEIPDLSLLRARPDYQEVVRGMSAPPGG